MVLNERSGSVLLATPARFPWLLPSSFFGFFPRTDAGLSIILENMIVSSMRIVRCTEVITDYYWWFLEGYHTCNFHSDLSLLYYCLPRMNDKTRYLSTPTTPRWTYPTLPYLHSPSSVVMTPRAWIPSSSTRVCKDQCRSSPFSEQGFLQLYYMVSIHVHT